MELFQEAFCGIRHELKWFTPARTGHRITSEWLTITKVKEPIAVQGRKMRSSLDAMGGPSRWWNSLYENSQGIDNYSRTVRSYNVGPHCHATCHVTLPTVGLSSRPAEGEVYTTVAALLPLGRSTRTSGSVQRRKRRISPFDGFHAPLDEWNFGTNLIYFDQFEGCKDQKRTVKIVQPRSERWKSRSCFWL